MRDRRAAATLRLVDETGTTLIETMIAVSLLVVVMAGLLGMSTTATTITENQGHLGARATEYAVDKMEQLLELTYGDAQSNTTVFPSVDNGGSGLTVGGSSNTAAPVVGSRPGGSRTMPMVTLSLGAAAAADARSAAPAATIRRDDLRIIFLWTS